MKCSPQGTYVECLDFITDIIVKGLKGESGKPDEFIAEWTIRRERTNQSK